jgi:hypothetical protein
MKIRFSSLVLASAAIAVASMAAVPAMAATSTTLNVPFSFTVNGRTLPAGEYSVVRDDSRNFVRLQSKDASQSYTWLGLSTGINSDRVTLRFDAGNEQHALESIQYGTVVASRIDRKSRRVEQETPQVIVGQ